MLPLESKGEVHSVITIPAKQCLVNTRLKRLFFNMSGGK